MNILPVMITMNFVYIAYRHYSWHPPQSWKSKQIQPDDEIKKLANKAGIRKDLKFYSIEMDDTVAMALGNNSYNASKLAMVVDPAMDITRCHSNERNFILRHEFAHIKYNDNFHRAAVTAVASVTSLVVGLVYMTPITTSLLAFISSRISWISYSRFMERRADRYALKHSSMEEINFFFNAIKESLKRNSFLHKQNFAGKIKYSSEGNSNTNWDHDPLTSRLKDVEAVLKRLRTQKFSAKRR